MEPPPIPLNEMVTGAAVPFFVTAIGLVLSKWAKWIAPLVIGASVVAGLVGLMGWPPYKPVEAKHWLLCVAAGSAIMLLLVQVTNAPMWLRWIVWIFLSAAALGLLVQSRIMRVDTRHTVLMYAAGYAIAMAFSCIALDGLTKHATEAWLPFALGICAGITAIVIMLSGSITYGQLGGVLAMCLLGTALAVSIVPSPGAVRAAAVFFILLNSGVLILGMTYLPKLHTIDVALLAIAPLFSWVSQIPALRNRRWLGPAVSIVVILLPAALAFGLAFARFQKEAAQPKDEYEDMYSSLPAGPVDLSALNVPADRPRTRYKPHAI